MPKEYQSITIKQFHSGEVFDPKTNIAMSAAQVMRNVTFDRVGKIGVIGREGCATFGDAAGQPVGEVLGFSNFTDSAGTLWLVCIAVVTATHTATLYSYDYSDDEWDVVEEIPDEQPNSRYTFASHYDQTTDTLKLYFTNGAGLYGWDGTTLAKVDDAPLAKYLTSFDNSLFLLHDLTEGANKPMRAWFSDCNLPESWGPFNNVDFISTNTTAMTKGQDGSAITGWFNWGGELVLAKRNALMSVQGYDIETIQMQRRDLGLYAGCSAPFSVAVTPKGAMFLDSYRVWQYSGGEPAEVSRAIIDVIRKITDFQNVKAAYIESDSMTAYWMTLDISTLCETFIVYDVTLQGWRTMCYTKDSDDYSYIFSSLAAVENPADNRAILLAGLTDRVLQVATGTDFREAGVGARWEPVRPTYRSPWFGTEDRMAQAFRVGLVGRGRVEVVVYYEGSVGTNSIRQTRPMVFDLDEYVDPGEPNESPVSAFDTFKPVAARRYCIELRSHEDGDKWWVEQIMFDLQTRGKFLTNRSKIGKAR